MTIEWESGVRDGGRVAALEHSGLVGTGPEDAFDRLVELAVVLTGADRSCITLVDAKQFTYKSTVGVPEGSSPSGPVEDSFCRYVVGASRPLIVNDALHDPRVCDHPAISLYGVAAWAGYPIEDINGAILDTFCVIDANVHIWSERDILVLATLAKAASTEIALRMSRAEIDEVLLELNELKKLLSSSA